MSYNAHNTKDNRFSRRQDEGGLGLCTQGNSKVPMITIAKYVVSIFRVSEFMLAVIAEKLCL